MFRKHQDEFGEICHDIRNGHRRHLKSIICSITPGGGKSMLPVIAASQLIGLVADRICWVVPRRSLQAQAEAEFLKPQVRALLGHRHAIRRSTNEPDPCRGLSGFATTYQAIGMGNYFLREEFRQRRYILVLDEPHHVEEGGAWEAALAPLVGRAALTIYMSGTLERGNRRRIGFLPYRDTSDGEIIDLSSGALGGGMTGATAISYSRRDALLDRAILPIHFELMDGTAQWIGRDGETYSTTLSTAHKDTAEALYTALKTQFAVQLLDECTAHWMTYRLTHPRSKLLVVTANIEDAKKYVEHLHRQRIRVAIATSDDSAKAATNIEHFKSMEGRRSLDALVTVAMAYEGLDVPSVTHIACLTHIRSKPWIEQMIARATRFDEPAGPWQEQMAYIYVPDDRNMCAIIDHMKDEQISVIKATKAGDEEDGEWGAVTTAEGGQSEERNGIVPVGSQGVGRRWNRVGHLTPHDHNGGNGAPRATPSQQEATLREEIQTYCKRVDLQRFERKWGETNKRVVKYFGKPRTAMTLTELQRVMAWLETNYPLQTTASRPGS